MREINRIDRILEKIKRLWKNSPDQRLFQLLFNYTSLGTRTKTIGQIVDPFYYEDNKIEEELDKLI